MHLSRLFIKAATSIGAIFLVLAGIIQTARMGFFATPENRQLLQQISQKYPSEEGGSGYRRTRPNEILFEYYIIYTQY